MLAAVRADGYADATVANVIARAGVARASFYRQFTDKDDCFLALYREISACLLEQVAEAVSDSSPKRAVHVVIRQLIEHAEAEPVQAQFLVSDALAGGSRALAERGRAIGQIAGEIHAAQAIAGAKTAAPDLPTQAVIGATQWLIAQRMRRGERQHAQLARELEHWVDMLRAPDRAALLVDAQPRTATGAVPLRFKAARERTGAKPARAHCLGQRVQRAAKRL